MILLLYRREYRVGRRRYTVHNSNNDEVRSTVVLAGSAFERIECMHSLTADAHTFVYV